MNVDSVQDEMHLRVLARNACLGGAEARDEYQALMQEAHNRRGEDYYAFRELYLYYIREVVLREMYEEYIKELEPHCREDVLFRKFYTW